MKTFNRNDSRNNRLAAILATAALSLALSGSPAKAAELITDGGFESPVVGPGGLNSGYQNFLVGQTIGGAWTVIGSPGFSVSIVPHDETGDNGVMYTSAVGNQSLDLTGSTDSGAPTGVEQAITTTPGQLYSLSFYLGDLNNAGFSHNGAASVIIKLNGTLFQTVNNNGPSGLSVNWVQEAFTFTATGPTTTLDFINNTAAGVAVNGLDQVSVTPVPEPAVGALLGALLCCSLCARFAITVVQHPPSADERFKVRCRISPISSARKAGRQ
jgi:hypothetical protein